MVLHILLTTKKAFFYRFFPTKEEEEEEESSKPHVDESRTNNVRTLIEIRDVYPPPEMGSHNPWQIKKTLNRYEITSGRFVISFIDAFEYVLRYWRLEAANWVACGGKIGVVVCDVTQEKKPKKYKGNDVYLQMMANDDCVLACLELVKDRDLKVDDEIHMYWDSGDPSFKFRLLL